MHNQRAKAINFMMLLINITAVMFLTVFIYLTTQKICNNYIAREFLGSISALPGQSFLLIIYSGTPVLVFIITFLFREIIFPDNVKLAYITFVVEFILSIFLVYILDSNYNGILLLVFANVVARVNPERGKFALMAAAIISYLLTDFELISINFNLFSINSYFSYYDANTQQYLMGFYNLLLSSNIILFVIYCIYVIQEQRAAIKEVNMLYQKLSEANEDLEDANAQLQEYAAITEKMGETKERNRLAREIHDTLGHTLTGLSAGLDACITTIDQDTAATKRQLENLSDVTRQGIREVRRSVSELRPDALERLNLEHAIQKLITDTTQTTNAKIFFQSSISYMKFDEDEENAIYRVIQESITNAIRHGRADKIRITMKKTNDEIDLTIKDNGFGAKEINNGFGTRHIKERIEMLHGTVHFDGSDGFTVSARLPIRWGEKYD